MAFFEFLSDYGLLIIIGVVAFGFFCYLAYKLAFKPCVLLAARIRKTTSENLAKKRHFQWHFNPDTKILTISGNGNMPNYWSPWPKSLTVEHLVIKDGVTSIGKEAFALTDIQHCKSINLGNTLESIGASAFSRIVFEYIKELNNYHHGISVLITDFYAGNPAAETIHNKDIHKIVLPKTLKRIDSNAFESLDGGNKGLTYYFLSTEPPTIGENVFGRGGIQVPKGCFQKYVTSPGWSLLDANRIGEREISLMGYSDEEIQEIERRKKKEEEEKRRAEEKKRKEAEEREKAELAAYREKYEAEQRKKLGLD